MEKNVSNLILPNKFYLKPKPNKATIKKENIRLFFLISIDANMLHEEG
jgi:hypothetical protein